MSSLDWAYSLTSIAPKVGVESVAIDGYDAVNEAAAEHELEAWERQLRTTYRVIDLSSRKTIATGVTFAQAHELIRQGKAANQQARYDIRTEIR